MDTLTSLIKKGWWKLAIVLAAAGLGVYLKSLQPVIADCTVNQQRIDSLTILYSKRTDSLTMLTKLNDSLTIELATARSLASALTDKRTKRKQTYENNPILIDSSDAYLLELLYEYLRAEQE